MLLASTALCGVLLAAVPSASAQQQKAVPAAAGTGTLVLDPMVVTAGSGQGAADGIIATRSAGATKTGTLILETPQVVNVVTRDQMEAQGAHSVAEALRYTPGVQSEANGYDVRYDWLWIRGFNTYGTTWVDGLVIPGDSGNYATPSIDGFAVERVEVIKGPASVLYGRSVPGGLVNIVTKRPQATPHREASIRTSGFGGIEGAVDLTGPLTEDGAWLYRFVGLARDMHSQVDRERDRRIMLAPSISWKPSNDTSLTFYGYYQRDRDIFSPRFYPAAGTLLPNPAGRIPRDLFLGEPDAEEFNRDYYAAGYEFSHRFNDAVTVRQNLRYGRSEQYMHLALVNPAFAFAGKPSKDLSRVAGVSDDWTSSFAVDTQAEFKIDTGPVNHTLLTGVDYVYAISDTHFGNSGPRDPVPPPLDFRDPRYGGRVAVPAFQTSTRQEQTQFGFYLQDQARWDNWVGTVGLRYDISEIDSTKRLPVVAPTVTTRDEKLTARVGLTYLFDNGIAPYASYSTSFLPLLGTDRAGNPFKAQTAEQFEIGVKYEPPGGWGMLTLSLYQVTMENTLTPDASDPRPTRPSFYTQGGRERVRGIEIEGKFEVTPEIDVIASYAYSDSEVLRSNNPAAKGREMLRLPEHQGSVWGNYRPAAVPGLSLRAGVRAMSAYQSDSTYLDELRIPARALVDLGAEYDFGHVSPTLEGTRLRVNVSNLFDDRYVSHCLNLTGGSCNYGAGRAVTATLSYAW